RKKTLGGSRNLSCARGLKGSPPDVSNPASGFDSVHGLVAVRFQPVIFEGDCPMRALVWHGKEDIRCDTVSDPQIEDPRDAIIKVTSCAICGSDLHLFHNLIPAMLPGDIMGHETMGEVVEVGTGVNGHLKKGERVVIPFTI